MHELKELVERFNFKTLKSWDLIEAIRPLLERSQFFISSETGKITLSPRLAYTSPWVFARHDSERHCNLWHQVLFNGLGVIPSDCCECYKVVVRPRTLIELFQLHLLQMEMGLPSKCGVEVRPTVHGNYGGYFYCNGEKHGQEVYERVRNAADEAISPDVPIILKRFCTEFEHEHGSSKAFQQSENDKEWERIVKDIFDLPQTLVGQPHFVQVHTFTLWIRVAYERGDKTALLFNDGEHIYTPVDQYQEETERQKQARRIAGGS
jgi:hypothetical protein